MDGGRQLPIDRFVDGESVGVDKTPHMPETAKDTYRELMNENNCEI